MWKLTTHVEKVLIEHFFMHCHVLDNFANPCNSFSKITYMDPLVYTETLSVDNLDISIDLTLLSEWSKPDDDFLKNLENSQAKPESQSASYLKF